MNNKNGFLLEHNLVVVPKGVTRAIASQAMLGTVISNMAHYGYMPNVSLYNALKALDESPLIQFWDNLKPCLESITGADKNMGKHIVYKNFPKEVLDMSDAQYWIAQILMYWGLPNELFTQDEKPRDSLLENTKLKVLQAATNDSLQNLYDQLLGMPTKWTINQKKHAVDLLAGGEIVLDLTKVPFKENLVLIAVEAVKLNAKLTTRSATDVLRFGVALSDGDFSLKTNTKFKSFPRSARRFLLGLLENTSSLEEDMARDSSRWKKFMKALRPGDYAKQYQKVVAAYASLYHDEVRSFNSSIETLIASEDEKVLALLESRPGEMARRLQVLLQTFGRKAVDSFAKVAPKLKVIQLLKLRRFFATVQGRYFRTFAPKGNWGRMQVITNDVNIRRILFNSVIKTIDRVVKDKVTSKVSSVNLDARVENVALQGNDADMSPYGRNTKFEIPKNVTFIRTASYWKCKTGGWSNWFDNGINFFDDSWKSMGTCCWNSNPAGNKGYAVFSGDPTNSKTSTGEACQMIDIYLDKAAAAGVRYAVWNILCFSKIPFDQAEVYAAMQWGEHPQKGQVFEPSRCQLSFPVKGKVFTKYIAMIDFKERTVIYIDANLKASTSSAKSNEQNLTTAMPAYMEYLETQPTIHDLFKDVPKSKKGIPVLYDDENVAISTKKAYVFKPLNKNNEFTQINLSELLSL